MNEQSASVFGNYLYAFGDRDGSDLSAVERAPINSNIYVLGGYNSGSGCLSSIDQATLQ